MKIINLCSVLLLLIFVNYSACRKRTTAKKNLSVKTKGPKNFQWTALDLNSTLSWVERRKWDNMKVHHEIYYCYGGYSIYECKKEGFEFTNCKIEYKGNIASCQPEIYPGSNTCGTFQLKTYLCDPSTDSSSFNCLICNCTKMKYVDHCLTTISEFSSAILSHLQPTSTQVNFKIQLPSDQIQRLYKEVKYDFRVLKLDQDSDMCETIAPDFNFQESGIEEGMIHESCNNRSETGCPWTVTNLRPDTLYCFYGGFRPHNSRHLSEVAYQRFRTKTEDSLTLVIIYIVVSFVLIVLAVASMHWILKVWGSMKSYARETPPTILLEIKRDMEHLLKQQQSTIYLNYQPRQFYQAEKVDQCIFQQITPEKDKINVCNYVTMKTEETQSGENVRTPDIEETRSRNRFSSGDGGYGSTDEDKQHRDSNVSMVEYIAVKSRKDDENSREDICVVDDIESTLPLIKEDKRLPAEKIAPSLDYFRKNVDSTVTESPTPYASKQ